MIVSGRCGAAKHPHTHPKCERSQPVYCEKSKSQIRSSSSSPSSYAGLRRKPAEPAFAPLDVRIHVMNLKIRYSVWGQLQGPAARRRSIGQSVIIVLRGSRRLQRLAIPTQAFYSG